MNNWNQNNTYSYGSRNTGYSGGQRNGNYKNRNYPNQPRQPLNGNTYGFSQNYRCGDDSAYGYGNRNGNGFYAQDREKIELQSMLKEQFKYLMDTMLMTTNLEFFLHQCVHMQPYSIRNTMLIIRQTNGTAIECHGKDEWANRGVTVHPGANPIKIFAPMDGNNRGKQNAFCITFTYDVSDTDGVPEEFSMDGKDQLDLLNSVANTYGWNIALAPFNPDFKQMTFVDGNKRTIYLRKDLSERNQIILATKELALRHIEDSVMRGKVRPMNHDMHAAMANLAAFELSDYLGMNPSKIHQRAKELILQNGIFENNLKYANNVAYQIIKKMKDIISSQGRMNNSGNEEGYTFGQLF